MPLWINRQNTDTEAVAESLLGLDIFTPKEIKSNFTTAITNLKSLIDTNMENNIWEGTAAEYGEELLSKVNVTPSGELAPYPTPMANAYLSDAIVEQTGWEPGTWDSGIHQKTTKRPGFSKDGTYYHPGYAYSDEHFYEPIYQVTPVPDIPEPVERMEEWRRELTGEELLTPNMPASIWEGSGTPPPPSFGYGGAPYMPQKEVFTQQQVESAFLPQFAQRPEMYQYVSSAIPQLLSGIQAAPIGTTLPDYTELQMPSLESSFAQTPGYYREQARIEQDLLREEADVERAASVRRGQLRSGAQNIFGRRQ